MSWRSFLAQCSEQVQHERVHVGVQLGHDERHAPGHQAADECHVAAEPVQLADNHWAFESGGPGQRGGEARSPFKPELAAAQAGDHFKSLGRAEAGDGAGLGVQTQAALALLGRPDAPVNDGVSMKTGRLDLNYFSGFI